MVNFFQTKPDHSRNNRLQLFSGLNQLSEKEMMQNALLQSIQDIAKNRKSKNNTDDEYDSP